MDKQVLVAFDKVAAKMAAGQRVTCKRVLAREDPSTQFCGLFVLGGCGKPF